MGAARDDPHRRADPRRGQSVCSDVFTMVYLESQSIADPVSFGRGAGGDEPGVTWPHLTAHAASGVVGLRG